MGNLKISKAKKKNNSKGTSGIPNWLLSVIISLVLIAVVAGCTFYFISNAGWPMRWTTAMELDGYKVDVNMMSYYYNETCNSYLEQQNTNYENSYYESLYNKDAPTYSDLDDYLIKKLNFDRKKPHEAQKYKLDDEKGNTYETWKDFFIGETKKGVKELLVYHSEAVKLGVTLDKEDYDAIDEKIEAWLSEVRATSGSNAPEDFIFSQTYGKSVRRQDVKKAMELSVLASKCSEKINNDVKDGITDSDITKEYDENKNNYNLVDYLSYSFDVSYSDAIAEKYGAGKKADDLTDAEKAEVLALYKTKIEEARAKAAELAAKTELKDFKEFIINYDVTNGYDDLADSKIAILESTDKPSEENLKTIKDKTISAVIAEVTEGKTEVTDDVTETEVPATDEAEATKTYTVYGISVTDKFASAIREVKSSLFTSATQGSTINEEATYIAPTKDADGKEEKDALSEWLFSADRKANEITTVEEGDGANSTEITASTEKFTAEVAYLTKPAYKDETPCRDVAYMVYASEDAAKKAIEAIKGIEDLDKDKFLEVANDKENPAASNEYAEEYAKGTSYETAFDEWLFSAEAGSYTAEPIAMSDGSSYIVAYCKGESKLLKWQYMVKADLYSERYTARREEMTENFESNILTFDEAIAKTGQ